MLRHAGRVCRGLGRPRMLQPAIRARPSHCRPSCHPAHLLQRWDAQRKAAALAHWRRLLADKAAAADNLRRCLTRKRIAFRQFRQWYWESFDDDMQVRVGVLWGRRVVGSRACKDAGIITGSEQTLPAVPSLHALPPVLPSRGASPPTTGDAAHHV